MSAVYKKELKGYFTGFMGYVFIAVMLVAFGIFSLYYNLMYQSANFEYVYGSSLFIYLIAVPILTMRIFSEERKQRTDQLLYSLPLKMSNIVLGKYFAALTVLAIPCAITGLYPVVYSFFGTLNMKIVYTSLVCFFLLGAALIAVCMFISSLTENQIIAAIISFVALFVNYFVPNLLNGASSSATLSVIILAVAVLVLCAVIAVVTKNMALAEMVGIVLLLAILVIRFVKSEWIEAVTPDLMSKIALFDVFYDALYGSFKIGTVVLYLSAAFLFNFFSVQVLEKRRWA